MLCLKVDKALVTFQYTRKQDYFQNEQCKIEHPKITLNRGEDADTTVLSLFNIAEFSQKCCYPEDWERWSMYNTCVREKKKKKKQERTGLPVQCLWDKSSGKNIEWVEFICLSFLVSGLSQYTFTIVMLWTSNANTTSFITSGIQQILLFVQWMLPRCSIWLLLFFCYLAVLEGVYPFPLPFFPPHSGI